ncbi:hypothetical protein CEXT_464581 [Caerostris extrusa]|uniref:Uncharacterized protein n=1 Tax=Caerostris extrusa TaxID=172846 RepID=A0AAV4MHD6_CAEEX|nr:hypothetical protein CEXT_464581 [Caerostris extrusa]
METAILTKDISFSKLLPAHFYFINQNPFNTSIQTKKQNSFSWPSHLLRLHQPTLLLTATVTARPCICLSERRPVSRTERAGSILDPLHDVLMRFRAPRQRKSDRIPVVI